MTRIKGSKQTELKLRAQPQGAQHKKRFFSEKRQFGKNAYFWKIHNFSMRKIFKPIIFFQVRSRFQVGLQQ